MQEWAQAVQRAVLHYKGGDGDVGYGSGDCCQFISRYLLELTGTDYAAGFAYDDEASAKRLIVSHGGLPALISTALEASPDPAHDPQPGDVAVVHVGNEMAAGVVGQGQVLCLHPDEGFVRCPAEAITDVWPCLKS